MKIAAPAIRKDALPLARRVLLTAVALYLTLLGGLLGMSAMHGRQAAHSNSSAAQDEARIAEMRSTLAASERRPATNAPADLQAVARFQAAVERSATLRGCALSEFRAAAEAMPYLSRFSTQTTAQNWSQVEVQMAVTGRARALVAVLDDLRTQDVPFEFNTMELNRAKANEAGDADVTALISLRVLIRGTGGRS